MTNEEKLIKLAASKHEIKLSSKDILDKYELGGSKVAAKSRWIFSRPVAFATGSLLSVGIICALVIPNVINLDDSSVIAVDSTSETQETTSITTDPSSNGVALEIAPSDENEVVGFEILSSVELFDEESAETDDSISLNSKLLKSNNSGYREEDEASFEDIVDNYEKVESIIYQASNINDGGIAGSLTEGEYEGVYGTYTYRLTYDYNDIILYYNLDEETVDSDEYDPHGDNYGEGHGEQNHFGANFDGEIVSGTNVYQTTGTRETDEDSTRTEIDLRVDISDNKFYYVYQMAEEGEFSYDYLLYETYGNGDYYGLTECYSIRVSQFDEDDFICSATVFSYDDSKYDQYGSYYYSDDMYEFYVTREDDYYLVEYWSDRDYKEIYLYYTDEGHKYVDGDTNEEILK